MATAPLGPVLEAALKEDTQGGTFTMWRGHVIYPRFFCCVSGTTVGVSKDPVARKISTVTRVCAGSPVCIDFSKSWSPSSTIASWSIDWGDGQVSGGAWPDPLGTSCHPLGGYVLPGVYTVVLTVIDMLTATGTDTQEIEVIDCDDDEVELELYAGCGSSGVWHSWNAGLIWDNVSRGVLLDTEVYDLKVNPFTIGTDHLELWAATEKGLYKTIDAAGSWARITLPEPEVGLGEPDVASVVCSTVDPLEVYVLAYVTAPTEQVWLYRTTDGGVTWSHTTMGDIQCTAEYVCGPIDCGVFGYQERDYYAVTNRLYTISRLFAAPFSSAVLQRNPDTQTWGNIGKPAGSFLHSLVAGQDYLWVCGENAAGNRAIFRWDGSSWITFDSGDAGRYEIIIELDDNRLYCLADNVHIDIWDKTGWRIGQTDQFYPPLGIISQIGKRGETLLIAGSEWGSGEWTIARWTGFSWIDESHWPAMGQPAGQFCDFNGDAYLLRGWPREILKRSGVSWYVTDNQPGVPRSLKIPALAQNEMWCGTYVMYAGTDVWVEGRTCQGYTREYGSNGDILSESFNAGWIIRTDYTVAGVSDEGRTHLLSMSADGWFVYAAVLDGSGKPIVLRVDYDLSVPPVVIHDTGAGTWGGVKCDYNHSERVWVFGDFGAASKVLLSDGWGSSLTNVTDGTWAANELVRAVLPSIYDYNDLVAILSTDQESWHSGNAGTTWVKTGDLPYGVHCGERDWIEDLNVFVGRVDAGADHIRYSPNNGVHWYERSGGFEPNAPVTALQVVA